MSATGTASPEERERGRRTESSAHEPLELPAEHLLGRAGGEVAGPLFFAVGGMHGNEPAGVFAIRRVLARIAVEGIPCRGTLVGLAGNLEALRRGTRFVERDLNRMWSADELAEVRGWTPGDAPEGPDQRARRLLLAEIEGAIGAHEGEVFFLDLHSTSATSAPFSIIGDTLRNRRVGFSMPAPVILGLEELVDGALLGYFGDRGHVAVGFEGGANDDPLTIDHAEAALWLALIAAGVLDGRTTAPIADEMRARLAAATRGLPEVLEVRVRHHVDPDAEFVMNPGFANFTPVVQGEVLARDRGGTIVAVEGGRVLLPLYQGQGQDGFFLGREVRRVWLGLSAFLRGLRLEGLLWLLPGVRRDGGDRLLVDPHVARFWPVEIFHLFGFRRIRPRGGLLAFSRRIERPRRP